MVKKCRVIGSMLVMIMTSQVFARGGIRRPDVSDNELKNFIVKWEFYKLCQFGYDPETDHRMFALSTKRGGVSFNPKDVKEGDLIFLRARHSKKFFLEVVPEIQVPFIIVAHGEFKDGFKEEYMTYLEEPKLIAWFGTHPLETLHDKFHPIPLGMCFHKSRYAKKNKWSERLAWLRAVRKDKLVYANFATWVHEERSVVKELFNDKDYVTWNSRVSFEEYLAKMAKHKFVFSPRGLGPDCYRTWEALLVGSIPIVKKSHLDNLYKGLPVLIVDNWEEITEEFLNDAYHEIVSKSFDLEKLTIEYWYQVIDRVKYEWKNSKRMKESL